jgi:hypothetical protein
MWHRSHNHSHFAKHFTKWLQLHQRSHFTRVATATAVLDTAEALPKGPLVMMMLFKCFGLYSLRLKCAISFQT